MVQLLQAIAPAPTLSVINAPRFGGMLPNESPLARGLAEFGREIDSLPTDSELYLDHIGGVHRSKDELFAAMSDGAKPVLAVRRELNDELVLSTGLPSLRGVSLLPPDSDQRPLLKDTITVPGGTELYLAAFKKPILLPKGDEPLESPDTIMGGLQRLVVGGAPLVIGRRNHLELRSIENVALGGETVSRIHVHVTKVLANPPCYRVRDGIDGPIPILASERSDGQLVSGRMELKNGMTIHLGDGGPTLTYRSGKTVLHDERYTASLNTLAKKPELDLRHRHGRGGEYTQMLRDHLEGESPMTFASGRTRVDTEQTEMMERFIRQGALLVSRGEFGEALSHLRKVQFLALCGIDLRVEENHQYTLRSKDLTPERVSMLIRTIAADSWFRNDYRLVYPSTGNVLPECYEEIERLEKTGNAYEAAQKRQLVRDFEQGCCLLHLEEYIHGLQLLDREAGGSGLVSRGAALIRGGDREEVDVVFYLSELGVNFSTEELLRYENRFIMHRLREGVQEPEEQVAIQHALAALPPGQRILFIPGDRAVRHTDERYVHPMRLVDPYDFIQSSDPARLRRELTNELLRAKRELDGGIYIEKDMSGAYVIEPAGRSGATVLVPDDRFRLAPIHGPTTVLGGTFVQFGFYRFRV